MNGRQLWFLICTCIVMPMNGFLMTKSFGLGLVLLCCQIPYLISIAMKVE